MTLLYLLLAAFAGIFSHYARVWKDGRTEVSFKDYMLKEWVGTLQSVLSSTSIITGIYLATPDISGNLLLAALYGAYTTGYTADSLTNVIPINPQNDKKIKEILKNEANKPLNDILRADRDL